MASQESTPDPHGNPASEPYHGTRGYSGSSSSRDAAHADLTNGITNAAQKYVLIMAQQAGHRGVTVSELREKSGTLHHGRVSSALTKMHIVGRLVALTDRRGNAGIYVLPEHVDGRETRTYRRAHRLAVEDIAELLEGHVVEWNQLTGWRCKADDWRSPDASRTSVVHHLAEVIHAAMEGKTR